MQQGSRSWQQGAGPSGRPCRGCGKVSARGDFCDTCRDKGKRALKALEEPEYGEYYDAEHLRPEYVDTLPDGLAIAFATARPALNKHQMRAFFQAVKRCQVSRRGRSIEDVVTDVKALKGKAQLRLGRNNIPQAFKDFIDRNVDRVCNDATLTGFSRHFEALVAFSEGRLNDKESER